MIGCIYTRDGLTVPKGQMYPTLYTCHAAIPDVTVGTIGLSAAHRIHLSQGGFVEMGRAWVPASVGDIPGLLDLFVEVSIAQPPAPDLIDITHLIDRMSACMWPLYRCAADFGIPLIVRSRPFGRMRMYDPGQHEMMLGF
jgi:hypothetical protein